MRHSGIEYGLVLEGNRTELDFETYTLRAGDSVCFDSLRPHLYENHYRYGRSRGLVRGRAIPATATRPSRGARHDAGRGFPLNSAVDVLGVLGRMSAAAAHRPHSGE